MLAQMHVMAMAQSASYGAARAGLPFVGEPRKPEDDLARPTAIQGET
jgi:hypothetical protein